MGKPRPSKLEGCSTEKLRPKLIPKLNQSLRYENLRAVRKEHLAVSARKLAIKLCIPRL